MTRDGPVLKPGARAYDRAWIRDGALEADAFLRAGQPQVAKDFARPQTFAVRPQLFHQQRTHLHQGEIFFDGRFDVRP